uniref:Inhibitor of apoptosis protein 1 n=1 Tax=Eriocheir hepuensis TaxID=168195 RepID=A0A9E9GEL5_9EUCA|nr:inhibitor of apoptosis protein 1 [Eriocheir hepuensis]
MGDASLNTPKLQGGVCQVSSLRENNNITGEVDLGKGGRTKKFISYDSLRFEKERLETFIDWPVKWLKPEDLARDGFYYLRTADHCACVFCRGIVGAWEYGDTPREEHKRHFPQCPFVKGEPVGNIPYAQSMIISHITPSPETALPLPLSMDVCGMGRPMPGSYPECKPPKKADLDFRNIDLPQHTAPKRKDFLSQESREMSFIRWPDQVKQTPKELAEAGFFYCGLSDHVRCYHCGNGLRNWEKEDDPWEEHARWYPECVYVHVKKGQEFIDKVRREKPPYLRSQTAPKTSSSSLARPRITESEIDPLMELDIIKATLEMGFPADKVRPALRRKLEQTGLPFFNLEACIEAVLQYMEEETRLTLRESSARSLELEAASQQGAKMQTLQAASERQASASSSSSIPTTTTTATATVGAVSSSSSTSSSSSASSSSQHDPAASNTEEPMETESSPITPTHDVLSQADYIMGVADQALNADPTSSSSPTPNPSAEPSLVTSATSTPTNPVAAVGLASPQATPAALPTFNNSPDAVMEKVAKKTVPSTEPSIAAQDPAVELEKIKDSHMCKVCMDAEIDMVFLPCTHMVTCSSCALALAQCPICRTDIKYAIKPILS